MGRWLEAHGGSTLPALKPFDTDARAKLHVHVKLPQLLLLLTKIICSTSGINKKSWFVNEKRRQVYTVHTTISPAGTSEV